MNSRVAWAAGRREAHVLSCLRALSARACAVGMIVARARALDAGACPTRYFVWGSPRLLMCGKSHDTLKLRLEKSFEKQVTF